MSVIKESDNQNPGIYHLCHNHLKKTRIFIIIGLIFLINFYWWLLETNRIGHTLLYILICLSLIYKGLTYLHEWVYYWSPKISLLPDNKKKFTLDIFTTYCKGEPKEMIKKTLLAIKEIRHEHKIFLCDESADNELNIFCKINKINYVTRIDKKDAKAGNINNALKLSNAEICLVLDPDHIPKRNFIQRTIHHFNDEKVGFVQSVQSYYNQEESLVAKAAAEQSYQFYGPLMMGMNSCSTVQVIGANCLFRRKALDSIGGHAAGLAEDMHTGLLLQSKGWKGIYVPEVLSKGLVPQTIKSYCEQQLKWSKGVFDILLWIYPKLFFKINLRQKVHYLWTGLYFSKGWITLLDIIIPVISLMIQETGIQADNNDVLKHVIPLFVISIIIRLRSQENLMEEHEKGYHLMGGILQSGTWYINIKGFILSLLKRKLPYKPTKKNKEVETIYNHSLPNIGIIICNLIVIIYSIMKDTVESQMIILYISILNMINLTAYIYLIQNINFKHIKIESNWFSKIKLKIEQLYKIKYNQLKKGYWILTTILFFTYISFNKELFIAKEDYPMEKEHLIIGTDQKIKYSENIPDFIKTKILWDEQETDPKENNLVNSNLNFIELEIKNSPNTKIEKEIYKAIYLGYEMERTKNLIENIRRNTSTCFINYFRHPKNDTAVKDEYIQVVKFLHDEFQKNGINNVVWVWKYESKESPSFYPGDDYVDWIYYDEKSKCKTASEITYKKARKWLLSCKKNIIIDVPTCNEEGENYNLKEKTLQVLSYLNELPEIKCIVTKPELIRLIKKQKPTYCEIPINPNYASGYKKDKNYGIKRTGNQFILLSNGEPFYIKGIAYNPGHDWRDGNYSLSRTLICKDFEEIKKSGANCIRIYKFEKKQEKILEEATKQKLKVIPGFWFDPTIDYLKDSDKKNELTKNTLKVIENYKNNPAILAWSLGNETWGLLKKHYAKPYLFSVRAAYTEMIEKIAEEIHKIDTIHPVMTCIEHDESQINSEIQNLKNYAPALDIIGINSYYKNQISKLDSIFTSIDSTRPYLVSEFGPSGYWNNHYNNYSVDIEQEENEKEKMIWYLYQWDKYIVCNSKNNIGGIAYCWQDRMEGSLTWFGITDFNRRKKAVYFSLLKMWNKKDETDLLFSHLELKENYPVKGEMEFICHFTNEKKKSVEIEWKLCTADFEEILHVERTSNSLQIEAPKKKGKYRIYSYIKYDDNKVSTASLGFVIK